MIEVDARGSILPRSMIVASCKSISANFYPQAADARGEEVKNERGEWANKARDAGIHVCTLMHALCILHGTNAGISCG